MDNTLPLSPNEESLPLFARLEARLRRDILDKRLAPGAKLPSEAALEAEFGVSRITVRQALAALHADGLIEKFNGKGSFVTRPADAPRLGSLAGFYDHMRAKGKEASGRTLSVRRGKAPAAVAQALQLEAGAPVTMISVLRLINGEPIATGTVHAEAAIAEALLAQDIDARDVMSILESPLGYRLQSTQIEAGAVLAGQARSRLLGVTPEAPLLRMRFTPLDISGKPLVYSEMFFRPERFAYRAVIRR